MVAVGGGGNAPIAVGVDIYVVVISIACCYRLDLSLTLCQNKAGVSLTLPNLF